MALVIEDDTRDRTHLVDLLIRAGYEIETASTAVAALERCQERAFDVITLSLLLPDASGWDVLHKMRISGPNRETPVVVITQVKEKQAALGFPIQGILTKPIHMEELLTTLDQARRRAVAAAHDGQRDFVTLSYQETRQQRRG